MPVRFGFTPVASGFLQREEAFDQIVGEYVLALERMGGERWSDEMLDKSVCLFYLVVTGGTEEAILKLRADRARTAPDEPAFLLAHSTNNSLPAALEVLARLQQDGERGAIFYLQGPDDETGFGRIEAAMHDLETSRVLKRARIGLVGKPSNWLVASSPDPAIVQERWGPQVVSIGMDEVAQAFRSVSSEASTGILEPLVANAAAVREPLRTELEDAARLYTALKQVVERHRLDALTVRCFDLVLDLRSTGCLALAQLTDEGVIAGCEGDLVSTVGMLWAYELLGQIPWMANSAQLDEVGNTLWLAHCTIPLRMVREYCLRSHFESGLGVGIQGTLPSGSVTLLRIGGAAMEKLWLAEGEVLQSGDSEALCRTQAKIHLTRGEVRDLLRAPLGNHLVLVPGRHADRLCAWWEMMVG
jgi:L-fucose isomerase-like protein